MTGGTELREIRELAVRLGETRQADILIYSGDLLRPGDGNVALRLPVPPEHHTCLLALNTLGGSADAAYRLARTLRRHYAHIVVYVDDYCKGAGMLLALAADELVISDFGELGPLDLVSQHAIIPGHGESGRSLMQGLQALRAEAEAAFEQQVARFRSRRGVAMSARAATEQASAMSISLIVPTFSQIDPLQVAEVDRAVKTATLYVQRLGGHHLKEGALERLLTGYPSHDFVIDREEASDLLHTVRAPNAEEGAFLTHLEPVLTARRLQGRLLFLDDALARVQAPARPSRVSHVSNERNLGTPGTGSAGATAPAASGDGTTT